MLDFEFKILDFIRENLSSPIMDRAMCFFSFLGDAGWIWILTAVILLCSKKYRRTGLMLATGLVLSLITANLILKPAFARLRPFQIKEGIELIVSAPKDFSFPSGHTMASAICATVIFLQNKKCGLYTIILAFLISFSRLYLYVHFPTDVLAGVILGILIGVVSVKIIQKNFLRAGKNNKY